MDALYARFLQRGRPRLRHRRPCRRPHLLLPPPRRAGRRARAAAGLPRARLRLIHGRDPEVDARRRRRRRTLRARSRFHVNSANPTVSTASAPFMAAADGAGGWEGQVWDATITVPCLTLDGLIAPHGVPAFIKIDVEGFEDRVLAGLEPPRAGAVLRVHHHRARCRRTLPRPARRPRPLPVRRRPRRDTRASSSDAASTRQYGSLSARPAPRSQFRRCLCRPELIEDAFMRSSAMLFAALALAASSPASAAATLDGLAVEVTNTSEPVLCAEKDNVTLNFASPRCERFHIEARIRPISAACAQDRCEPDWTACEDISAATSADPPPRKVTFYEDVEVWLTGYHLRQLLARQGRAVPGRRPGRAGPAPRPALGAPERARRGGARASTRPTATGASARCRPPISAGAPTAPRSSSGRWSRTAGRW